MIADHVPAVVFLLITREISAEPTAPGMTGLTRCTAAKVTRK
jgi:hypothetical protein